MREGSEAGFSAVDGKERVPQHSVDWRQVGPNGRLFHGIGKSNADFYDYGAEVLAVADARVSNIKDSLAENTGTMELSARSISLESVFGNYVILDLGEWRFAVYAHLQSQSED
jgi:hypothetical protein